MTGTGITLKKYNMHINIKQSSLATKNELILAHNFSIFYSFSNCQTLGMTGREHLQNNKGVLQMGAVNISRSRRFIFKILFKGLISL